MAAETAMVTLLGTPVRNTNGCMQEPITRFLKLTGLAVALVLTTARLFEADITWTFHTNS